MLGEGGALAGLAFTPSDFGPTLTESSVISQGHKYSAVIVIVISKEFENVLVEQNHCQGLKIVMRSWHTISKSHRIVRCSSLTAVQAVLLPSPYIFSDIFQV